MKASPQHKRIMRHKRVRARLIGSAERPRLSVYKSNASFFAQIIDDATGKTIVSVNGNSIKGTGTQVAAKLGELIAQTALKANIKTVAFDRGGFAYHGRVKAFADAAREAGLKF